MAAEPCPALTMRCNDDSCFSYFCGVKKRQASQYCEFHSLIQEKGGVPALVSDYLGDAERKLVESENTDFLIVERQADEYYAQILDFIQRQVSAMGLMISEFEKDLSRLKREKGELDDRKRAFETDLEVKKEQSMQKASGRKTTAEKLKQQIADLNAAITETENNIQKIALDIDQVSARQSECMSTQAYLLKKADELFTKAVAEKGKARSTSNMTKGVQQTLPGDEEDLG